MFLPCAAKLGGKFVAAEFGDHVIGRSGRRLMLYRGNPRFEVGLQPGNRADKFLPVSSKTANLLHLGLLTDADPRASQGNTRQKPECDAIRLCRMVGGSCERFALSSAARTRGRR